MVEPFDQMVEPFGQISNEVPLYQMAGTELGVYVAGFALLLV